jgi:hypothetical protein
MTPVIRTCYMSQHQWHIYSIFLGSRQPSPCSDEYVPRTPDTASNSDTKNPGSLVLRSGDARLLRDLTTSQANTLDDELATLDVPHVS